MSAESINPRLRQFITRYVSSVEQVEVLCLFSATPEKSLTSSAVFRVIQSSEKSVAACLRAFVKEGFLVEDPPGEYRLTRQNPELVNVVGEMAKAYRERRVSVVEAIYQKPSEGIQNFADAFKLRKDK